MPCRQLEPFDNQLFTVSWRRVARLLIALSAMATQQEEHWKEEVVLVERV